MAARNAQDAGICRNRSDAPDIGRGQSGIQHLAIQIRTAEEFPAIRRGDDLELLCLGKIRPRGTIGIDNPLGQQVAYSFLSALWHVSCEEMIEAAIFSDNDDDVLNGCGGADPV